MMTEKEGCLLRNSMRKAQKRYVVITKDIDRTAKTIKIIC